MLPALYSLAAPGALQALELLAPAASILLEATLIALYGASISASSLPILLQDHGESSELLELIKRHEASGGTATQSLDGIRCIGRDGVVERSAEVMVGLVVTLCIA